MRHKSSIQCYLNRSNRLMDSFRTSSKLINTLWMNMISKQYHLNMLHKLKDIHCKNFLLCQCSYLECMYRLDSTKSSLNHMSHKLVPRSRKYIQACKLCMWIQH